MRVLVLHSRYLTGPASGENVFVEDELRLLSHLDWETTFQDVGVSSISTESLRAIAGISASLGLALIKPDPDSVRAADCVLVHNTFPTVDPASLATLLAGTPSAWYLHNFRFVCLDGTWQRSGSFCDDCSGGGLRLDGIRHGCYRSRTASLPAWLLQRSLRSALTTAKIIRVPSQEVADAAARELGIAAERFFIDPPFVSAAERTPRAGRAGCLVVGRLSPEKGLVRLFEDWPPAEPLSVVGDGPLRVPLQSLAKARNLDVSWLGPQPRSVVQERMSAAEMLVVSSIIPETFGLVALEAMAVGTPILAREGNVIASRVASEGTGVTFGALAPLTDAIADLRARWEELSVACETIQEQRYSQRAATVRRASLVEALLR